MPTNLFQFWMRKRFLEYCPEHPTRKQAMEAARRAGYSEKKIPQKIPKFLVWAAERDAQKRGHEENPAATRSAVSGKILPARIVLAERENRVHGGQDDAGVSSTPWTLTCPPHDDPLAWFRDDQDGTGERIFFDVNGELVAWIEPSVGADRRQWALPAYTSGLSSSLADYIPNWGPAPMPAHFEEIDLDDPLGNPDLLEQASFEPGVTAHFVR